MPDTFSKETLVGANWRCSQSLRAFFQEQVGGSFHFNKALRDFISTKEGHTLSEAIECYKASLYDQNQPIAEQFEYNRHIREFHLKNPGASHKEAVNAWWAKRNNSKS